jgi:hypothetical protein
MLKVWESRAVGVTCLIVSVVLDALGTVTFLLGELSGAFLILIGMLILPVAFLHLRSRAQTSWEVDDSVAPGQVDR